MSFRRFSTLALLAFFAPATVSGQAFDLRNLLSDFLRRGITLAPPITGVSHVAHFIGADSPQFLALQQFSAELANQLSSFPLASPAGGFTYRFDPTVGVFSRVAESFGPIYAERAATIGKGKFNVGLNFSHFTFDQINKLGLRDGDVRFVFTHEDVNRDGSNLQPHVEGDLIAARLFLKITTDITAFVLTFGVSDRFDIGVAVPIVRVQLEAQTNATVERIATGPTDRPPTIHRFSGEKSEETFRQAGRASGVGDVLLRGKFRLVGGSRGGLSLAGDFRLPTGEERDLLGTGAASGKASLIGSLQLGPFSPHVNAGYALSTKGSEEREIPDEISYNAGFDWALHPRMTVAVDILGRNFRNAEVVRVVETVFRANTNPDPATPPTVVGASFPRLISETKNPNMLLGSVGFKVNPFGNFLLTLNGLFALNREGLQDDFAPLVAVDYSF